MRVTGSEALVEVLRLEGVTTAFGINGSAIIDPLDLFTDAGIRFVQVRNEQSAGMMADGYTQISGRPGVCIGQNGPGITNLVSGVAMAYANHSPMVVLTPSPTSAQRGSNAVQEVDQMKLLSGITVYQHQLGLAARLPWALRSAFRAAHLRRGPAQLDIPRDLFYSELDYEELPPERYRHGGRTEPARTDIDRACALLRGAERPVILCGMGMAQHDDRSAVSALAERLDAAVASIYNHNDAYDNRDPRYVGPIGYMGSRFAMEHLCRADVVLALGTRLNPTGIMPQYDLDFWPRNAALIHNDDDPMQIGVNVPVDVGIAGDCAAVARALVDALGPRPDAAPAHLDEIARGRAAWDAELAAASASTATPMPAQRALYEISRNTPDDAVLTTDAGNAAGMFAAYFTFSQPRSLITPGSFGAMGGAFPGALGAKLAAPARPVLSLCGDGAWGTAMQEVMTAVQENIPVVSVVLNNGSLAAERSNQRDYLDGRYFACELTNPDFAEVATAMGAQGMRVTRAEEIGPAMAKAFASDVPSVIDVVVDKEVLAPPRRRDALSARRRLHPRYTGTAAGA